MRCRQNEPVNASSFPNTDPGFISTYHLCFRVELCASTASCGASSLFSTRSSSVLSVLRTFGVHRA